MTGQAAPAAGTARRPATGVVAFALLLGAAAPARGTAQTAVSVNNGTMITDTVWSQALGANKALVVYLPPSYRSDRTRRFPVAYYLAFCVEKTKYTWLLIVITPFLTSYLLRIFAWKVVLGDQGLINSGLASLGVISADKPISFLIYSQFTVMVVLTYAWVPFICLPIFISLENMDRKLLEAATDLGANRAKAFRKITLPLAAPGIVAAFLFVFIPSIGEYITPSLVGGTRGYMFGQAVADHFIGGAFDWQGGSVLALFLLTVVLFLTATTSKFLRAGGGTA